MTSAWIRCDDLQLAAAFATLGVPAKLKTSVHSDTGRRFTTALLGAASLVRPEIKTAPLMKMVREGVLNKADPEHPLLYALEGIKNFCTFEQSARDCSPTILLKRKGTFRCALVKETASDRTLATADRFLKGYDP